MNFSEKETALNEIEYLKTIVDFFKYVMTDRSHWDYDENHKQFVCVLENGMSFTSDEVSQAENSIGALELCVKGEYNRWLDKFYDDHAKYSIDR